MDHHAGAGWHAQASEHERLLLTGVMAEARVRAMRATGRLDHGDPEVEMELDVELDGRRIEVIHRQIVSALAVRSLRLGAVVPVRVDPADPSILSIP